MKNYKLDPDEKKLLKAFEEGHLKPIANSKEEVARLIKVFKASGNKTSRVNLRMNERDYLRAKEMSFYEGIPYQTLLSSILHKYFTGQLVEKA